MFHFSSYKDVKSSICLSLVPKLLMLLLVATEYKMQRVVWDAAHRLAMTLIPLTGEVINIDHLVTVQCSTVNAWLTPPTDTLLKTRQTSIMATTVWLLTMYSN